MLDRRDEETLQKALKPLITELVKDAFLRYARAHGCKPENEVVEWTRFNRFLQKKL